MRQKWSPATSTVAIEQAQELISSRADAPLKHKALSDNVTLIKHCCNEYF